MASVAQRKRIIAERAQAKLKLGLPISDQESNQLGWYQEWKGRAGKGAVKSSEQNIQQQQKNIEQARSGGQSIGGSYSSGERVQPGVVKSSAFGVSFQPNAYTKFSPGALQKLEQAEREGVFEGQDLVVVDNRMSSLANPTYSAEEKRENYDIPLKEKYEYGEIAYRPYKGATVYPSISYPSISESKTDNLKSRVGGLVNAAKRLPNQISYFPDKLKAQVEEAGGTKEYLKDVGGEIAGFGYSIQRGTMDVLSNAPRILSEPTASFIEGKGFNFNLSKKYASKLLNRDVATVGGISAFALGGEFFPKTTDIIFKGLTIGSLGKTVYDPKPSNVAETSLMLGVPLAARFVSKLTKSAPSNIKAIKAFEKLTKEPPKADITTYYTRKNKDFNILRSVEKESSGEKLFGKEFATRYKISIPEKTATILESTKGEPTKLFSFETGGTTYQTISKGKFSLISKISPGGKTKFKIIESKVFPKGSKTKLDMITEKVTPIVGRKDIIKGLDLRPRYDLLSLDLKPRYDLISKVQKPKKKITPSLNYMILESTKKKGGSYYNVLSEFKRNVKPFVKLTEPAKISGRKSKGEYPSEWDYDTYGERLEYNDLVLGVERNLKKPREIYNQEEFTSSFSKLVKVRAGKETPFGYIVTKEASKLTAKTLDPAFIEKIGKPVYSYGKEVLPEGIYKQVIPTEYKFSFTPRTKRVSSIIENKGEIFIDREASSLSLQKYSFQTYGRISFDPKRQIISDVEYKADRLKKPFKWLETPVPAEDLTTFRPYAEELYKREGTGYMTLRKELQENLLRLRSKERAIRDKALDIQEELNAKRVQEIQKYSPDIEFNTEIYNIFELRKPKLIPAETSKVSPLSYSITSGLMTKTIQKQLQRQVQTQSQKQFQKQFQTQLQKQVQTQSQVQVQKQVNIQKQLQRQLQVQQQTQVQVNIQKQFQLERQTTPFIDIPIDPPPDKPDIIKTEFMPKLRQYKNKRKQQPVTRPTRYQPSVVGIVKNVKRKKKKGFLTGLEIRGIEKLRF